jgi:hypothetical protein
MKTKQLILLFALCLLFSCGYDENKFIGQWCVEHNVKYLHPLNSPLFLSKNHYICTKIRL